jgi:hypothetical protein
MSIFLLEKTHVISGVTIVNCGVYDYREAFACLRVCDPMHVASVSAFNHASGAFLLFTTEYKTKTRADAMTQEMREKTAHIRIGGQFYWCLEGGTITIMTPNGVRAAMRRC